MSQRLASRLLGFTLVFMAALSVMGLAVTGLTVTGLAQAAGSAQQALLDTDAERIAAFLAADTRRIAGLLADDLTYVHTSGIVDGKGELLGKIKSGELVYQSIKTHDAVARRYGTAGVVTGVADVHVLNAHRLLVLSLRYTATYALHEGHWQLVAYESTQLPG